MKTRTFLPPLRARALTILSAVLMAALLAGCAQFFPAERASEPKPVVAEKKPPPKPIKPPPPSSLYEWYGADDYVSHIEVDVNQQKAHFYSGDKEVGWTRVASGIYKYPTPIGTFAVMEKVQDKRSNLYGTIYNKNGKLVKRNAKMGVDTVPAGGQFKGASMPYFLRLTNDGIGMHAGPIPRPGRRASHGCIRMPRKFAPILYRYVDVGTKVTINGKGPSYASYLAKQRRSRPQTATVAAVDQPKTPVANTTNEPTQPPAGRSEPATSAAATAPQPTSNGESSTTAETGVAATTMATPDSAAQSSASSATRQQAADEASSSSSPEPEGDTVPNSTPSTSDVAPASAASATPQRTPASAPGSTGGTAGAEKDTTSAPAPSAAEDTAPVESPTPPPSTPAVPVQGQEPATGEE